MIKFIQLTILIYIVTCIHISFSYAASKEDALKLIEKNERALKINKRVIQKYHDSTQWFVALNDYGTIIFIPLTPQTRDILDNTYMTQGMLLAYNKVHDEGEINGNI